MMTSENWMEWKTVFHLTRVVKCLGLTHEKWDENDSENFADSDDSHILQELGVIIECCER